MMEKLKKFFVDFKYVIAVILIFAIAAFLLVSGDSSKIKELLNKTRKKREDELKAVHDHYQDKKKNDEKLQKKHDAAIKAIENSDKLKRKEIDENYKKEVKKLVKKAKKNPDKFDEEFTKKFGIKLVDSGGDE